MDEHGSVIKTFFSSLQIEMRMNNHRGLLFQTSLSGLAGSMPFLPLLVVPFHLPVSPSSDRPIRDEAAVNAAVGGARPKSHLACPAIAAQNGKTAKRHDATPMPWIRDVFFASLAT